MSDYLRELQTPNGPGVLIAKSEAGQLFVAHHINDLTPEARAKLRPGGAKCVHRWYAPAQIEKARKK